MPPVVTTNIQNYLNYFFVGRVFFCMNLLFRVKLGYTSKFTFLGHPEVPKKFVRVGWVDKVILIITLRSVELSWIDLRIDQ